jgi:hypothetical protein
MIAEKIQDLISNQPVQGKGLMNSAKERYDNLVQRGLIQKKEYDIPQVNVFGPKHTQLFAPCKK